MSHQCLADAFAPVEARYRAHVLAETWGHLAPQKNKTYRGYVTFAIGCFGSDYLNPTVLDCTLKGLDDSSWFYDALAEFLSDQQCGGSQLFEIGGVYKFEGTFRNYAFKGTFQKLTLERCPCGAG